MAKESMKAREVKRAKLVAKYAAKRAQLLKDGDYDHDDTIELCRDSADKYKDLRPQIWKDITEEEIKAGHGGKPNSRRRAKPSSSVLAVVTKVMFIPRSLEMLSMLISGKMICSWIPSV